MSNMKKMKRKNKEFEIAKLYAAKDIMSHLFKQALSVRISFAAKEVREILGEEFDFNYEVLEYVITSIANDKKDDEEFKTKMSSLITIGESVEVNNNALMDFSNFIFDSISAGYIASIAKGYKDNYKSEKIIEGFKIMAESVTGKEMEYSEEGDR